MKLEAATPADVLAAVRAPFGTADIQVNTPVAQPLSVYLDLAGEALRERLFLVQGPGREESCLRPDFTLGIALAHIARGEAEGRYYYEGPAFRVAPPGSDRTEQFLQIGLEAYGSDDPIAADASIASLAWRAALAGGRSDLTLLLGDVGLFGEFLAALGVPQSVTARLRAAFAHPWRLKRELHAAMTDSPRRNKRLLPDLMLELGEARAAAALEEIWALAGVEPVGGRSGDEIVRRLMARTESESAPGLSSEQVDLIDRYLAISGEPEAALDQVAGLIGGCDSLDKAVSAWRRRLAALSDVPADRLCLSTAFARGFGYYDGILFEVRSKELGEDQPVAAGGRYDNLPARLGGKFTAGAIGCMVRPGRAWREGAA